MSVKGSR